MARSPNYPQLSLPDAVERVRKVWNEEEWNKVAPLTVAEHLGFKGLSGTAQVAISALRKYGLLEGSGEELKVSKRAMMLLEFPRESQEYRDALVAAANDPTLFAELAAEQGGAALPTEANLRTRLLSRDFSSAAASKAARAYLETMRLVLEVTNGYTEAVEAEDSPAVENLQPVDEAPKGEEGATPSRTSPRMSRLHQERRSMNTPADAAMREDVFSMAEGDVVLQWPSRLTQESFEDFKDWLGLIERKARRAIGPTETPRAGEFEVEQEPAVSE